MGDDRHVGRGRRARWFWPTIVLVIAVVVALAAWTLVQTSTLGDGPAPSRPDATPVTTATAVG